MISFAGCLSHSVAVSSSYCVLPLWKMIDYSKWNNIEISDDEDDTHPNIDKQSLFKWRHEARLQRMKEFHEKKENLIANLQKAEKELDELKSKQSSSADDEEIKKSINKLEKKVESLKQEEIEIKKQERLMPWNVDTISSEGWSKTKINKPVSKQDKSKLR